jgi:DNA-binding beta-propeller fold protein YncE
MFIFTLFAGVSVSQPMPEGDVIDPANAEGVRLLAYRTLPGAQEVAWSPGGRMLAAAAETQVLVFDTTNLQAEPIVFSHDGTVIDLVWSPDGSILATASLSGQITLWVINIRRAFDEMAAYARDLAYSPDGSLVAYVDYNDATVHLWNILRDRMVTLEEAPPTMRPGTGIAFSGDGRLLVAGRASGEALVWDVRTGNLLRTVEAGSDSSGGGVVVSPNDGTAYSLDDQWIAVARTRQPYRVIVADPDTGDIKYVLGNNAMNGAFVSVAFNPESDLLAAAGGNYEDNPVNDGITLWDVESGTVLAVLSHADVRSVTFSPDGALIASAGGDMLRIWGPANAALIPQAGRALSDWQADAFCESEAVQFEAHRRQTVGIGWSWFAIAPDLIDSHIASAMYEIRLDGRPVNEWVFLTVPQDESEDFDNWTVYYYLPLGRVEPGAHTIDYRVSWRWIINDGYDAYGPGTRNLEESGSCRFAVLDR